MTREEAWTLVREKVGNRNLQKHMLATEACLRALAARFGADAESWGLAGLVHDLDYEETARDPARHGIVAAAELAARGVADEVVNAVKAHAGNAPVATDLDRALFAVDPITGLIVAAALMHPDKRLAGLDTEFVLRRYREKKFAAGASREQIATCANLGLTLEEFTAACLDAMKGAAAELGL
ncbi:MAG: HDIG domain-containing protein [bacterium]